MLDVRIPMGILFVTLGALLFFYGLLFSEAVPFYTPNSWFPLKLNQPVGAFMFIFGMIVLTLARFVRIQTTDRELSLREKELDKAERRRQKALAKRVAEGTLAETGSDDEEVNEAENATDPSSSGSSSDASRKSDSPDSSK